MTESQKAFLKTLLGLYITNNIVDPEDKDYVKEYIDGMLAEDEFYYTIPYIVDEVIKEPEWEVFLNKEGLEASDYTEDEWKEYFTEVLKTIDYDYLYEGLEPNKGIRELSKLLDIELDRQAEIRKKKEEEEKKKREEEEKKKKEEEEKKAAEKAEEADAEEIKDPSTN